MKLSTLTTLIGATLPPAAVAGGESTGNYQHNCSDIKMVDINRPNLDTLRLRARCDQNAGGQFLSQQLSCLDLNKCYANQHGLIYPKPDGDFGDTCKNCSTEVAGLNQGNPAVLHCICLQDEASDTWINSVLDTNELIENDGGFLRCSDYVGTVEECPPWP